MQRTDEQPRYPIRAVALRTGLSSHVIRVWERRYGAIIPKRKEKLHRLYSEADIYKLKLLHRGTLAGHSISKIAPLCVPELEELLLRSGDCTPSTRKKLPPAALNAVLPVLAECQAAVMNLDPLALETGLLKAQRALSARQLINTVVAPLLAWVGEEWSCGNLSVAQEHSVSVVVRDFLGTVRKSLTPPGGRPTIVLSTPVGQYHEFGALLAAIVSASEGWRDFYLGPNLPAEEIVRAVLHSDAGAVGLSVVHQADIDSLVDEIQTLRQLLPDAVPLIIGGRAAQELRPLLEAENLWVADDVNELTHLLDSIKLGLFDSKCNSSERLIV